MTERQREKTMRALPIFRNAPLDIIPLHGGMTNYIYRLKCGQNQYVARFAPKDTSRLGLSRQNEISNQKEAARLGIGADVIAHYPGLRLLIVDYLPGDVLGPRTARRPETIRGVARMLGLLHRRGRIRGSQNGIALIENYLEHTRRLGGWMPAGMKDMRTLLARILRGLEGWSRDNPCHQDLMRNNVLITPAGEFKLLDWEYAARFDERYDLAFFAVRAKLDPSAELLLIDAHGGKDRNRTVRTFTAMKALVYLAEAAYDILQNRISKKPLNYKGEAEENWRQACVLARRLPLD